MLPLSFSYHKTFPFFNYTYSKILHNLHFVGIYTQNQTPLFTSSKSKTDILLFLTKCIPSVNQSIQKFSLPVIRGTRSGSTLRTIGQGVILYRFRQDWSDRYVNFTRKGHFYKRVTNWYICSESLSIFFAIHGG